MKSKIPEYCGFECPHADFPPAETAGICRTMSAVWCRKLKRLVNKNAPCACGPRSDSAGSRSKRARAALRRAGRRR